MKHPIKNRYTDAVLFEAADTEQNADQGRDYGRTAGARCADRA